MYIIADEERESLFRYSGNMGKILFPDEKNQYMQELQPGNRLSL